MVNCFPVGGCLVKYLQEGSICSRHSWISRWSVIDRNATWKMLRLCAVVWDLLRGVQSSCAGVQACVSVASEVSDWVPIVRGFETRLRYASLLVQCEYRWCDEGGKDDCNGSWLLVMRSELTELTVDFIAIYGLYEACGRRRRKCIRCCLTAAVQLAGWWP